MALPLPEFMALASACAPAIPAPTLIPLIQVESGFNPLAINVNGEPRVTVRARSRSEAVLSARRLIAQGRSVDLGLGQINSKNLGWLDLSIEAAFDPCRNLAASARVLQDGYQRAAAQWRDPQDALRIAFSIYNTGHPRRGFDNGYVDRITRAAGGSPAIGRQAGPASPALMSAPPPAPPWDVFARAGARIVFPLGQDPVPAPALSTGDLP